MNKKILIIISTVITLLIAISLIFLLNNNKKQTYNVSFETNGGTIISQQVVAEGEMVSKPIDPTKEGYIFVRWIYQGQTYDFSSKVNSDLTLTAEWFEQKQEIETFIVTFNSEGGTTIPNQIIEEGNKVVKPIDPIKEGYTFKGWFLNEIDYNFDLIVENNIELIAKWEKNEEKKPVNNNSSNNSGNKPGSNIEIKITAPTLSNPAGGPGSATMDITYEGFYKEEGNRYEIKGWELYEKKGTEYVLIESKEGFKTINVTVEIGQKKIYVAKVYAINSKGQKVHSGYSNEYVFDNSLSIPVLTEYGLGGDGEKNTKVFAITNIDFADGIELYKSTSGTNYQKEKTIAATELGSQNNRIELIALLGEHNYYKVQAYKIVNGTKVYSEYSDVIQIIGPSQ